MQKRIYIECGAQLDGQYPGDKIWHEFCDRVGWRKNGKYLGYSKLTFDIKKSLAGEFPGLGELFVWGWGWVGGVFFSRIQTCEL